MWKGVAVLVEQLLARVPLTVIMTAGIHEMLILVVGNSLFQGFCVLLQTVRDALFAGSDQGMRS